MSSIWKSILVFALFLAVASDALASEEIQVGEVSIPNLRWGKQRAVFEVTNLTEDLKFIVITCEIQFGGSYVEASRAVRSSYYLEPLESKILRPEFYIPGSYGSAKATVCLYDVVDTLDALLDNQKVFEQPIMLNYSVPDAIRPYAQEKVTLPPFVDNHPEWDNEMSRMLLMLFDEGKTCGEIAAMAMADTSFIEDLAENMARRSVLLTKEKGYKPQFPIILTAEAEEEKKIADRLSDSLIALIKRNMPAYDKAVYGLQVSDAISTDTSGFLSTGTIMYRKYPMVGGMLLWYDLGRSFITRSAPLAIYDGTDLCNAFIPFYMYAVVGGDYFSGHHFYSFSGMGSATLVNWGDKIPVIQCEQDFLSKRSTNQKAMWTFSSAYVPDAYLYDSLIVNIGLKSLRQGADPLLVSAYNELKEAATRHGHEKVSFGHRFWFWDVVASRTLDKLVEQKVVERYGNGQFRLEMVPKQ